MTIKQPAGPTIGPAMRQFIETTQIIHTPDSRDSIGDVLGDVKSTPAGMGVDLHTIIRWSKARNALPDMSEFNPRYEMVFGRDSKGDAIPLYVAVCPPDE